MSKSVESGIQVDVMPTLNEKWKVRKLDKCRETFQFHDVMGVPISVYITRFYRHEPFFRRLLAMMTLWISRLPITTCALMAALYRVPMGNSLLSP